MGDRYEIINKFESLSHRPGVKIKMVTVKFGKGVFTMPEKEWRWVFGQCRSNRWKKNNSVA